jgi:hypothetical protein
LATLENSQSVGKQDGVYLILKELTFVSILLWAVYETLSNC